MRFALGIAVVIASAFALAGCGGADDLGANSVVGAPTDGSATPGTTVAGSGATGQSMLEEEGMNDIAKSQAKNGTPIKLSSRTPKAFVSAHCKRPIMVVLYQPGSTLDNELVSEANIAAKTVKDELVLKYTPKDVRSFGDLPSKLGLFSTPGLAIVARDGTIENFWSGDYIDNRLIAASLQHAASAKACNVAEAEAAGVAPAGAALSDAAGLVAGTKQPAATTAGAAATGLPATGATTAVPAAAGTVPGVADPAAAAAAGAATTVPAATATVPAATAVPSVPAPAATPVR